jgi:hypothetical protein
MTTLPNSEYVTRSEFELAMARIETRFERLDARLDVQFARLETRFAQIETLIERSSITSIRWIVGLTSGLYALIFGLILFVVSRELPH